MLRRSNTLTREVLRHQGILEDDLIFSHLIFDDNKKFPMNQVSYSLSLFQEGMRRTEIKTLSGK